MSGGDHTSHSPCNHVHLQDEDTVTMTMVTVVDSDCYHHCILRILTTAGQWPGCQEPAAGRYPLQPLQWRALQTRPVLQCCSVTRGAHTRFADICTPLQLQTAAAWPPLVAGCLAPCYPVLPFTAQLATAAQHIVINTSGVIGNWWLQLWTP